jgi:hypothetical protein
MDGTELVPSGLTVCESRGAAEGRPGTVRTSSGPISTQSKEYDSHLGAVVQARCWHSAS